MNHVQLILESSVKVCAYVAETSAKHPVHVVAIILLLSSVTYLTVIQYFLNEWRKIVGNQLHYFALDEYQLFRQSRHYLYNNAKNWSQIFFEDFM